MRTIQLAGYDAYYDRDAWKESRAYFQENLCRCVEMAAAWGISLGFETMETPFMNTVSKSMTFVAALDSPWLGVYPDCGNLTNAAVAEGGAVTADLKTGRGHLLAMHLKPTRPGVFRDMYFDDPASHVDFEADIRAAWALGVRRYVTELWCLDRPDWRANIATARRTMAAILERQEAETAFLHATWAAPLLGRMCWVVGWRAGSRQTVAVSYDPARGDYVTALMDSGTGCANAMAWVDGAGCDCVVATNREIDQVALYRLQNSDGLW